MCLHEIMLTHVSGGGDKNERGLYRCLLCIFFIVFRLPSSFAKTAEKAGQPQILPARYSVSNTYQHDEHGH